jgi:hypothetical protein
MAKSGLTQNGIANILSMSDVEKHFQVTYDSKATKEFIMQKDDRSERRFKQSEKGLYYHDTAESSGTVLVTTVANNKYKYLNREYKQAMLARKIQNMIGRPSM